MIFRARPAARSAGQAILCALVWLACERKAPGPEECLALAQAWFARERVVSPMQAVELKGAYDELVRRCLTDPYDRKLVDCVVGGRDRDRCRVDYLRRVESSHEERP